MPSVDPRVAHWFTSRRGIRPETVEAFGVYTDGNDIVFPYGDILKRRYSADDDNPFGLEKAGRRFVWRDANGGAVGAGQVPFLPPDFEPRETMILIPEGETDTMAVWQALPDELRDKVSVVGLSGVGSWKDRYATELFEVAKRVFVVLDNEDPYENPDAVKSVEGGWKKIRASLGKKARRVRLPQGQKDLAEFFMAYDWAAFTVHLKAAAQPRRRFPRLDFDRPVPETDWLVEDFLAMGEVAVLAADSGVGKSFLTMALAQRIIAGEETFLGKRICRHGPVLYVDSENAVDLIVQRMKALGLKPEHMPLLEYISFGGVNLFSEGELLVEEALEIEPVLIVLDSQTALSIGAKENDNDDMTRLYVEAIKPLARLTGAAVVVIHHVPHDGGGRPRGGGAIKAQADMVWTITKTEAGGAVNERLHIFPSKPRRLGDHLTAQIVGDVEHDGWVRVEPVGGEDVM